MFAVALTGPNGLDVRNTLSVTGAQPRFEYQNVPVATGDSITLSATSVDGAEDCMASAMFDIVPGQTTDTMVFFVCKAAPAGARDF